MLKIKVLKKNSFLTLSITASLLLGGCAAITGHQGSLDEFNKKVLANNCDFKDIDEKIEKKDDLLLWSIQGGSLARNCKDYKKSNYLFDHAEIVYKEKVDKDNIANDTLETAGSVLVNNNINDYEGNTYEKIMVNTYKALNFASLGDHNNARVEFNRALDRQRRAKEYFQKEIKEQKEEIKKKEVEFAKKEEEKLKKAKQESDKKEKENEQFKTFKAPSELAKNDATQKVIYDEFKSTLEGFKAYPDFINPFTTYVSGLYFMLNNDPKKGRSLLKETLRMDPKNKQIKADYNLSNKLAKKVSKSTKNKYVWVIYENGNSIKIDEKQIHIPLFLFTQKAHYTGIAFPILKEQNASHKYLNVNGNKTTEICNMDNVIKTEFKKRFTSNITEILISNIFKTYAQYELQNNAGLWGGIAGALYQGVTNKADVRSWTTLPKNFQSVRIKNVGEPILIKNDANALLGEVKVPKGKNAIVYVRSEVPTNNRIHKIVF